MGFTALFTYPSQVKALYTSAGTLHFVQCVFKIWVMKNGSQHIMNTPEGREEEIELLERQRQRVINVKKAFTVLWKKNINPSLFLQLCVIGQKKILHILQ